MRTVACAVLLLGGCAAGGSRAIVSSDGAPKAIGPYSQAVEADGFVFLSGQVAIDPATQQMVAGGIEEQTERVLRNLEAVLKGAGLGMGDVVKTTVYVTDLGEFAKMNEVYARFFPKDPPARATVQVAALPKGARVEIEAVARQRSKPRE